MLKPIPYIFFTGNCKEAMEFYKEILGGELDIRPLAGTPMAEHMPEEARNGIMHSSLSVNGKVILMASDMSDENNSKMGRISLSLVPDSLEETKSLFEKLSEGGKVTQELSDQFFGTYGDLLDKYGVRWMLTYMPETKE